MAKGTFPLPRAHLSRHEVRLRRSFGALACGHPVEDGGERVGEIAGSLHAPVESDEPCEPVLPDGFRKTDRSTEPVGADDVFAVGGDELAFLDGLQHLFIIDTEDDDLVIGEQLLLDGGGERQPVKHRSERVLIVHGGELDIRINSGAFRAGAEDARCRGHEQPPVRTNLAGIQHRREVGCRVARAPVGLVRDDQIKLGHAAEVLGGLDPV